MFLRYNYLSLIHENSQINQREKRRKINLNKLLRDIIKYKVLFKNM